MHHHWIQTASLEHYSISVTVLPKLFVIVPSTSVESSYWPDHIPCEVSLKVPINYHEKIQPLKYQLFNSVCLFFCHSIFIKIIYLFLLGTCHIDSNELLMWILYQWLFNVYLKKEAKCFCGFLILTKPKLLLTRA